ncbi:major facilitator superfamily domain-containing protein [Desarmillaria tabescens]|uniref:Major facilitator superfamily domain-containing protein n=1 Tax=Armillaria tabescens TaxID=1929756 RepID=A0AA39NPN6_ARMTA|nr:major facilitator superfamily domain-containing protein [Desarmillaria tabescens]KAK0469552.1 major facilitator superfamily domain-containing protein [Desarmillaria tabescens]
MSIKSSSDEKLSEKAAHVAVASVEHGGAETSPLNPQEETRLLRKIDSFLIPMFGVLYFACFLDRGNIGNAKVAGMATDLHLVGNQYGAAVSVVYATYVIFEPVYAILLKLLTPKIVLSVSTLIFGALTIATPFSGAYGPLVAIRVLLGWSEAGVFPCIATYLTMTYRREELGRRLSYIFLCSALSGGFGGLLAYGLTHISTDSLAGWQWLYIVEGLFTVALAPVAFFWIPNRIDQAWFLNKGEKDMCAVRYETNMTHYDPDEKFDIQVVLLAFKDWRTWASGVIQFGADVTLYAISTFMPVLINGMGYSSYHAQLLTVPVYVVAALSFMIQAQFSDRLLLRGPFIIGNFFIQIIGYIILATAKPVGARYFGVYVVALGLYTPTALNVGWTQNNFGPHYKRAAGVGLMQFVGNSAGACIGQIFDTRLQPYYHRSYYISIALTAFSMMVTTFVMFYLREANKKKAEAVAAGVPNEPHLGDKNPHFTFVL